MSLEQFHTSERSSYYKNGQQAQPAGQWPIWEQANDGSAVPPAPWEIGHQQLIISDVGSAFIDAKTYPVVTKSDAASLRLREFAGLSQNRFLFYSILPVF